MLIYNHNGKICIIHPYFSPKPGDLRSICIEKSTEPLGIQISCGAGGGIFVSSVTKGSLADQAGLQVGDHLLEVSIKRSKLFEKFSKKFYSKNFFNSL